MDEILIEDKKYISSKRAAKITGYAKDYVGQLCREGRVPARLVGRSWYVLESALQDHRFGKGSESMTVEAGEDRSESRGAVKRGRKRALTTMTWEQPRYQAETITPEHGINLIRGEENTSPNAPVESHDKSQDSWQQWFDHISDTTETHSLHTDVHDVSQDEHVTHTESNEQIAEAETETISIGIKRLSPTEEHSLEDALRHPTASKNEPPIAKSRRGLDRLSRLSGMAISIAVAIVLTVAAILSTGILDNSGISFRPVLYLSGIRHIDKAR